jgi:hypothetical protein
MNDVLLLEQSFADAAKAIEGAVDLPAQTRTQWLCSLRQIAKALDKPMEVIPARWTAARFPIDRLHHAVVGLNPKTLANHKANARAALRWFAKEEDVPSRGLPLDGEWQVLRQQLTDRRTRATLSSLMRYFSARKAAPAALDEAAIDAYMRYRAQTTAFATDAGARRSIARAWNGCIGVIEGWPERRLLEPAIKTTEGPEWEKFPEALRRDIETHISGLTRVRRDAKGNRRHPCKPSTIRTRKAELKAAARMAVREGVPIESLCSLADLVHPEVAELAIEAYWKADGPEPTVYTIDLGWKLLSIARSIGCLDDVAMERLDDMRASLETHRRGGLTEKNMTLCSAGDQRQCLEEGDQPSGSVDGASPVVEGSVCGQGRRDGSACGRHRHPHERPRPLEQPRSDQAGQESHQAWRTGRPIHAGFPDCDVKNRVDLEFPFDQELTGLIDEYVHHFRPSLLRGSNELWLFPGETGGCKDAKTLSDQITERVEKVTGLFITVHQFRYAAAAIWLQYNPETTKGSVASSVTRGSRPR